MASKKKAKKKVRAIPKGYNTVCSYLNQEDSSAFMNFVKKAFGAKVRGTMSGPGGKIMHAEVQIGDTVIMMSDAVNEPARAASHFMYVENVDKVYAKALKAGGTSVQEPQDMPWGDRFARVRDPQGNNWSLATHVEDVSPKEMKKRMAQMTPPGS